MRITHTVALAAVLPLVLPSAVSAQPFSYAREHPAVCAEAWEKKTDERSLCGSREFCAAHKDDDRLSGMICDVYKSKANPRLDTMTLSLARLAASRDLSETASRSECPPAASIGWDDDCSMLVFMRRQGIETDDRLLPSGLKVGKLALRAHIQVYTFPVTVVRLGIASASTGVMEVTWNRNGNGPRETHSVRLNPSEIDRLLAAVNRSDFWRLPRKASHATALTDGEAAMVEISAAGWKDHVSDIIGDADAVDLSILVNVLTPMIKSRWKDVPA